MDIGKNTALTAVSIHDLSRRFNSKREMHAFLSQDSKVYLPPHDCITISYMKDIMRGAREVIYFERRASSDQSYSI